MVGIVEDAGGATHVVLAEPPSETERSEDLAGDERGSAQFNGTLPVVNATPSSEVGRDDLLLLSAAARVALVALCVGYAQEREAFGRTISKVQAVQHLLARLAGEAAAASVAAQAAGWALDRAEGPFADALLEAAAAKFRRTQIPPRGARRPSV